MKFEIRALVLLLAEKAVQDEIDAADHEQHLQPAASDHAEGLIRQPISTDTRRNL